jgi:glycosyltransferase involved in cell wall biosynthesis
MATGPYFVFGPATLLSMLGLMRGPDPTPATPHEDWRSARVDVIIPALDEEEHIVLCLASLLRQTFRPRRIILVDDGSTDRTIELAEAFCKRHQLNFVAIRRRKPIGKTPTIKRQARELDSDVEFILDADTLLESDNYIERTVQELYRAVGIASACGTILPLRKKDRERWTEEPETRAFRLAFPSDRQPRSHPWIHDLETGVTNLYREVLYLFLQRFVYRGQLVFFGTTTNPVGCAVAYRRKYVQGLFNHFGPLLGDDLTNSEDIFIGVAMLNEGYRNVQLTDVYARTVEPAVRRLPKQVYLWSSAFLQSCYYFDPLLKSPGKAFLRRPRRRRPPQPGEGAPDGAKRRVIGEPYRQAFGRHRTLQYGRPAGWMLTISAIEKVFFPTSLLIMLLLRNWHGLALTIAVETLIGLLVLAAVMKGRRLEYVVKGLAVAPLRYALVTSELVTLARFATDLWITNNRKWRK